MSWTGFVFAILTVMVVMGVFDTLGGGRALARGAQHAIAWGIDIADRQAQEEAERSARYMAPILEPKMEDVAIGAVAEALSKSDAEPDVKRITDMSVEDFLTALKGD